ncbi:MAG: hypothetical protein HQ523_07590 [Lentisphaerae bacterium]|nr:hypothetical protein [Lentisphaerota bacterium]
MLAWKPNWDETKRHFAQWWKHEGMVLTAGSHPLDPPHEVVTAPVPVGVVESYEDGIARAMRNHYTLAQLQFPGDGLPISPADIGPGSLALFLGSEPGFSPETVWFEPSIHEVAEPESLPPLTFDEGSHWWQVTETTCRSCAKLARGKYLTGCPDLVENIDIISALRDPQTLMMDMIERPEWVDQKVMEINQAFFTAYQRIYDIIKLPDGSACFGAFGLWGPGKTAKVQCDACAMFSPAMFERFVVPALTQQCEWLDCSMYHLDGTQCIDKLDHLLSIDALDAIEWTPQAGIEDGGDPRWYEMYHRILDGGKSLQAIDVTLDELEPLLDEIGPCGVYVRMDTRSQMEAERAWEIGERFR